MAARALTPPGASADGLTYTADPVGGVYGEAIYVLHCFRKKTQATSRQDKGITVARYRAVINARKERK